MIKIKETKSIGLWYKEEDKLLYLQVKDKYGGTIFIPMSKIFQVQRGLTSAIARFYRYGKKSKK